MELPADFLSLGRGSVIPPLILQTDLGAIDKWSSMEDLSLNALLKRKMIE